MLLTPVRSAGPAFRVSTKACRITSGCSTFKARRFRGRIFAEIVSGVPDGFRVNQAGYISTIAMNGIRCLGPSGRCLGKIHFPSKNSNTCFGGATGTNMFITPSDTIWPVRSNRTEAAHA